MIKKKILIVTFICLAVFIFSQCLNYKNKTDDPRGKLYAGSSACATCHKDIFSSYLHTAHYRSVSPATPASVHGSFKKESNVFAMNSNNKVVMEKRDSNLYQVFYSAGKEIKAERFDLVFGLVKGETYLYWKNNQLFQLPVSYSNSMHHWISTPGYNPQEVSFTRLIKARCFECHSSYIKQLTGSGANMNSPEEFDKKSAIYSIDCERCHGPGANHVNFQTDNPSVKTPMYIASYKSLSRMQKTDMCAQCHSGNKSIMLRSIFGFTPGDTLNKYKLPDFINNTDSMFIDVHGNQTQLLAWSKCFIKSNMDCATCHNTHENERGNITLYNERCKTCHTTTEHNLTANGSMQLNKFINNNCVNCHMPTQSSKKIIMQTSGSGSMFSAAAVNHRIAVYSEETNRIMKLFHN